MIILARHGETEWNVLNKRQGQQDSPLTEKGIQQANELKRLLNLDLDLVFASPLGRVVETINIMEAEAVILDNRLKEMNFGDAEGKVASEKRAEIWTLPFPNGESYQDVYERTGSFLEELLLFQGEQTIFLIVAHETVNRMLAGHILGLDPNEILRLEQPNGLVWVV